jgi:hypothetical protein
MKEKQVQLDDDCSFRYITVRPLLFVLSIRNEFDEEDYEFLVYFETVSVGQKKEEVCVSLNIFL